MSEDNTNIVEPEDLEQALSAANTVNDTILDETKQVEEAFQKSDEAAREFANAQEEVQASSDWMSAIRAYLFKLMEQLQSNHKGYANEAAAHAKAEEMANHFAGVVVKMKELQEVMADANSKAEEISGLIAMSGEHTEELMSMIQACINE